MKDGFLEKAAVLGLAAPTAAMVGSKAASLGKPNSYESEKDYREKLRGKNYGVSDKEDKLEEIRRSMEPSGGGGGEATARAKTMKKGGKVSSASSRADGCAVKGKTKGRYI
jgi:hypothetical protein